LICAMQKVNFAQRFRFEMFDFFAVNIENVNTAPESSDPEILTIIECQSRNEIIGRRIIFRLTENFYFATRYFGNALI